MSLSVQLPASNFILEYKCLYLKISQSSVMWWPVPLYCSSLFDVPVSLPPLLQLLWLSHSFQSPAFCSPYVHCAHGIAWDLGLEIWQSFSKGLCHSWWVCKLLIYSIKEWKKPQAIPLMFCTESKHTIMG
jgi:hypothetical protein